MVTWMKKRSRVEFLVPRALSTESCVTHNNLVYNLIPRHESSIAQWLERPTGIDRFHVTSSLSKILN